MNVPDNKKLGGRVRYARMNQRMTIKELAELAGMSHNYLSTIERDENVPSDTLLRRMAEVLKVRFDYLKNGDSETAANKRRAFTSDILPTSDYNADAALFLGMASKYSVVAGNEHLAKTIGRSEDELTKILSNTMSVRLTQKNYSDLAGEMDIAAALRGCSDLYRTLRSILLKQKLHDALRQYVNDEYGGRSFYKFSKLDAEIEQHYTLENGEEFAVTSLIVEFVNSDGTVRTYKFPYLSEASEEQIIAILKQEQDDSKFTCLVFTDEDFLYDFKACGERYAEEQMTLRAEAEMLVHPEYWGNVSLAIFDEESGSIEEQYFDYDD